MLAGQLILLYSPTLRKCRTVICNCRANFEETFVLNMSDGGCNEIFGFFCSRQSKRDKIKTYLPVKEKWRESKQYYD